MFRKRRKLYLVFEYVDHTVLEELEDHPKGLPSETARSHVFQVLRGIEFCHQNNVSSKIVFPHFRLRFELSEENSKFFFIGEKINVKIFEF